MKKVLHIGWSLIEVFIIVYVIILTSFILHRNLYGYTQFGKNTFVNVSIWDIRNITNVKKNDLLIIKSNSNIKENDLIYYYYVKDDRYIVKSNSVVAIVTGRNSVSYQIDDEDLSLVPTSRVIGTSASSIKSLGGILLLLENRFGFLLFVLFPIVLVFVYQAYDFIKSMKQEKTKEIRVLNDTSTIEYYEVPVIDKVIEIDSTFLNGNMDMEII